MITKNNTSLPEITQLQKDVSFQAMHSEVTHSAHLQINWKKHYGLATHFTLVLLFSFKEANGHKNSHKTA